MELSKSVEKGGGREAAGRSVEGSTRKKDVPNTVSFERYLASSACPILRIRDHEIPVRRNVPVSGPFGFCHQCSQSNERMRIIYDM